MINLSKTFNFPPRFLENSGDPFLRLLDVRGFDQCVSGKRNLLVTVGDSWTFGGSLWYLVPYAQHLGPQVNEFRLNNIFGNQLRQELDADWFNISLPYMNNHWMAQQLVNLNSALPLLDYDKIYVVVTLTEVARELDNAGLFNYYVGAKYDSIQHLVSQISKQIEDKLLSCELDSRCQLLVSRTYIDNSYPSLDSRMLPMSWLEVLLDKQLQDNCYFIGTRVINSVKESLTNNSAAALLDVMPGIENRLNALASSKYNIQKEHYRHPTPEGHKKWADYILSRLRISDN